MCYHQLSTFIEGYGKLSAMEIEKMVSKFHFLEAVGGQILAEEHSTGKFFLLIKAL